MQPPSRIWGGLLHGGQVVLMERGETDLERIGKTIEEKQITIGWLTAALFHLMVDAEGERLKGVGQLVAGGDVLSVEAVRLYVSSLAAGHVLVNGYGPTEGTTFTTCYRMERPEEYRESIPIGSPIANTRVYVLDEEMEPVPVGVGGEIYIGGDGLARGYVNRAGTTAERFIPDPYGREAGGRLYRTGDLGRWRGDGQLEFVGRNDDQVKLRGYRIELGEIEARLLEHRQVSQAVVMVREDTPGDKRLVAYYTSKEGGRALEGEELRAHLMVKLPEYMLPSAYVLLESLPLSVNGKVNRKALPAPEWGSGKTYEAPQGEGEEILAKIWAEVLGLERVGRRDNFFALGGDSILSIRIISRARQAGLSLTVQQLFQQQTIVELAAVAGREAVVTAPQGVVSGSFVATPIQAWFFEQQRVRPWHYNQSMLLIASNEVQGASLGRAIEALVEHHDILRLRYKEGRLEIVEKEANRVWTCVDVSELPEWWQGLAWERAAAQAQQSLNLEQGPVVRGVWSRWANGDRLLLVIHHLAVNGVSWRILLEDLETSYQAATQGRAIELPAKTSSYPHWAQALQSYAGSAEIREQEMYLGINFGAG